MEGDEGDGGGSGLHRAGKLGIGSGGHGGHFPGIAVCVSLRSIPSPSKETRAALKVRVPIKEGGRGRGGGRLFVGREKECNEMCKSGSVSALSGYSQGGRCSSQGAALVLSEVSAGVCFCVRGEILVGGGASGGKENDRIGQPMPEP